MFKQKITRHWWVAAATFVCAQASAQIVVIVNPAAAPPTKAQVEELYLGKNFDYKPVDIVEQASLRNVFYKKLTNREPAQIKAVWARVTFTGKGLAPIQLPDAATIKKAVATDPKAIGYIEKSDVDGSVKVVMTLE
jgi:hypothetical protein